MPRVLPRFGLGRLRRGLGLVLLASASWACTGGVVRPLTLLNEAQDGIEAADGGLLPDPASEDGSDPQRSGDGAAGQAGARNRGTAGSDDHSQSEDRLSCIPDPESADRLLEAFNRSISSGRFCPKLSTPLRVDPFVRQVAGALACFGPEPSTEGGWGRLPRGDWGWGWAWAVTAASFDAARAALLSGDNSAICANTADVTFKTAGASRIEDRWLIVVSDYPGDDTPRP